MKQTNKILWMVLIMVTIISVSCDYQQPTPMVASEIQPEQLWDFHPVLEFVGFVIPSKDYYLSFPISGLIIDLNLEEGDVVQSGDPIARLDSSSIKSDIARAEVDLAVAQANLEQTKAGTHPALIAEAESRVELAEAERPIGMAQATAQVANIKSAQARLDYLKALPLSEEVALAEVQVDRSEIMLEAARLRLNQTLLTAPIDGTILEVFIHKFEFAGVGQPVIRLSNLEILQIEIVVDDLEIRDISLGDKASVTLDGLPDVETTGEVIFIQPEDVNRVSGKYIVTLSLPDQPESILWGMSANVRFLEK